MERGRMARFGKQTHTDPDTRKGKKRKQQVVVIQWHRRG